MRGIAAAAQTAQKGTGDFCSARLSSTLRLRPRREFTEVRRLRKRSQSPRSPHERPFLPVVWATRRVRTTIQSSCRAAYPGVEKGDRHLAMTRSARQNQPDARSQPPFSTGCYSRTARNDRPQAKSRASGRECLGENEPPPAGARNG